MTRSGTCVALLSSARTGRRSTVGGGTASVTVRDTKLDTMERNYNLTVICLRLLPLLRLLLLFLFLILFYVSSSLSLSLHKGRYLPQQHLLVRERKGWRSGPESALHPPRCPPPPGFTLRQTVHVTPIHWMRVARAAIVVSHCIGGYRSLPPEWCEWFEWFEWFELLEWCE